MEANWEWYRSLLGVLEAGSLSAAARALGMTQPTVGRHIEGLEQALGLKLFTRSHDGYAPTEAALQLRPYAAALAASAAALRRVASSQGDGVRGTVRISASEVVGVEVLPPILARLRATWPELTIELLLSNRVDDLLLREADIAVRMVRPTQDALVARRVGPVALGFFAHRDYLGQHGTPVTLDDLAGHSLIGYDQENEFIRRLRERFPAVARDKFSFRSDSDLAQLSMLRAGYGIGVCQVALAAREPSLRRVLADDFNIELDTWVAMHEDLRDSPRCAVTFAALVEGLQGYLNSTSNSAAAARSQS
ncbi:LysR family transcriptional regulator [Rugamonas sp. CCM 8940]|uniref:LysR family transcriptional regulator n=1 Tax=Rugamonas sp. CCM 8940 TaxID=2765359 RepID=UPI0018F4181D|nr:LysR family transcriptional regulator [Rugamonas sp. CCM 8940]MBJ7308582.1 LysR family transcriptional regulator [Rugamonas sp. CCM 8940]